MPTCGSCGRRNPAGARFCNACAAPLADTAGTREERKVVTVLFADLVGFTARAERMDLEDVRELLRPLHARLRAELDRRGGTVEKFIGDAVMAVFGAPVAHEDDPERAVRAALAIRDAVAADGGLELRIGITTGEALIALDASPQDGEGMASGDVVNTAARLQAAAPSGAEAWDVAAGHFADARAMNAAMGARPWLAYTDYDHARMLLARGGDGDREEAGRLAARAAALAGELGMGGLSADLARLGG